MEGGCRSNGCSVEETIDGVMEKLDGEKEISKFDFVFSADGAQIIERKSLDLDKAIP